MAAYMIAEVEVLDDDAATRYRQVAGASVEAYGGRYLARGGPIVREGDFLSDRRWVVIEFPNMARLEQWHASPEYAVALALGRAAVSRRVVFLDGV